MNDILTGWQEEPTKETEEGCPPSGLLVHSEITGSQPPCIPSCWQVGMDISFRRREKAPSKEASRPLQQVSSPREGGINLSPLECKYDLVNDGERQQTTSREQLGATPMACDACFQEMRQHIILLTCFDWLSSFIGTVTVWSILTCSQRCIMASFSDSSNAETHTVNSSVAAGGSLRPL